MTLEELLAGGHRLRVPGFQRSFCWGTNEAGQLLDDVLSALDDAEDGAGDYFLGAVVLLEAAGDEVPSQTGASPGTVQYEIIDGLQRLITLTILFAVLRDIAVDEDPSLVAAAGHCVLALPGDNQSDVQPRLELPSETQAFFSAFVQEPGATSAMPDDDDLPQPEGRLIAVREHLMAALVAEDADRRGRLVQFLRTGCHCAVIVARTLDRAHRIFSVINDRGLPLARGDILRAEILGSVATERREALTQHWRAAEHALGGSMEELLSHLRTIEGRSRTRIIDEIRALVERSGDAETFLAETLLPYASILGAIRAGSGAQGGMPSDVGSQLRYLGWLGSHDWVPPLMLYWRMVAGDPAILIPFLRRLDRLAYGLRLLGLGLDKRATRYRALIEAIRGGMPDGPGHPLDLTRDELRLIGHNLRALHTRSQLACKLVLLRLNDILAGSSQALEPGDFSVEHVLPQKPGRSSQWRQWFPVTEERERLTQSLGNLILVSRHKNEEARNLDFDRKREVYFGQDVARLPPITRELVGISEWRPEDIRRREGRLIAALDALWDIGAARAMSRPSEASVAATRLRPRAVKPRPLVSAAVRR